MENANDKLQWLEYDLLSSHPQLVHAVFTRHGGVSQKPFDSLNFSESVGDHPDCVKVNRERVRNALGLSALMVAHSVHGSDVAEITEKNQHLTHSVDALITKETSIGLAVTHADCQAALFYDPVKQAIGIAHAGWRGSVQNIYSKTIDAMKGAFQSEPSDLMVCISPSLGPDHAEFKQYREELPESFWTFQVQPNFFNFWEISTMQLIQAGVHSKHIEIAGICSVCSSKDYFSHRSEKKTGRNASIIALRS